MGVLPHPKMAYYPALVNFDCFHCNVITNSWNKTSSASCEASWASYYDIMSSPSYSQKSCMDMQKQKKNDGRRQKYLSSPCNTSLKLLSPPPPQKKKICKTFYLQNGYLDFCTNQTILEIKGVGIWPAMGCVRFASLYPKILIASFRMLW